VAVTDRVRHAKRYTEIARLLVKHRGPDEDATDDAEALADDLESMGPTFIKLGQLLSTRNDLLPEAYTEALARLQDDVERLPAEVVTQVIEEDLGLPPTDIFEHWDAEPIASASLGQVHRGRLHNGHEVVVKVQRPDAREVVEEDMAALRELAKVLDGHTNVGKRVGFGEIVATFADTLDAELDYRREAGHLERLGRILAPYDRLVVPQPVREICNRRVLTMDYVEGRKVTTLTPVGRTDVDGDVLMDQLFRGYLDQILVEGFFHADPHPGNILLTDDGRLALLDLGMVATVAPRFQDELVQLVLAISEGRGEEAGRIAITMGRALEDFDERTFLRTAQALVAKSQADVGDVEVGTLVGELSRVAVETGLRLPPELTLLGKALLNLDKIAAELAPSFDPSACVREHAMDVLQSRLRPRRDRLAATALEARQFVEELPGRANRLLDAVADGELSVKVDAFDQDEMLRGLRQVANRVTMGLVLAALIVGAAMLARVDSGVATVCFVAAAIGAFWLLTAIAVEGFRQRR
jgi:predicted unusual protein kinase regulating ubiquinone biosynthesis (AarF/ABC1/UbiB family)